MFSRRRTYRSASPLRVSLIVPSSNTVLEPEFHQDLGSECLVSTTRIRLEDVSRAAELRMLRDLPDATELVRTTAPDVVVFGCTSAGALAPPPHDNDIAEQIRRGTGAAAVTVVAAVLARLRALGPRRPALFTPYTKDLTDAVAAVLADAGFPPVKAVGMGIEDNLEIGRVSVSQVIRFVESESAGCSPDCVFLSCTNWPTRDAMGPLEAGLGIPVLTSNQAAIAAVRSLAERLPSHVLKSQ